MGVLSIIREGETAVIKFHPSATIDPNRLLQFLGRTPQAKFSPAGVLSLKLGSKGPETLSALETLLSELAPAA
jgi:hypothetical protein